MLGTLIFLALVAAPHLQPRAYCYSGRGERVALAGVVRIESAPWTAAGARPVLVLKRSICVQVEQWTVRSSRLAVSVHDAAEQSVVAGLAGHHVTIRGALKLGVFAEQPSSEPLALEEASVFSRGLPRPLSTEKVEGCLADDGHVEVVGLLQNEVCVRSMADGGKACTDDSQCLSGACFAPGRRDPAIPRTEEGLWGRCSLDDQTTFGCHARLQKGQIVSDMCID